MGLFNRKKPGPDKAEKTPTPTRRRSHIVPLEIKLLALEALQAGSYTAQFEGRSLSSGVYFCRLSAGASHATEKLLVVK